MTILCCSELPCKMSVMAVKIIIKFISTSVLSESLILSFVFHLILLELYHRSVFSFHKKLKYFDLRKEATRD